MNLVGLHGTRSTHKTTVNFYVLAIDNQNEIYKTAPFTRTKQNK